MKRQGFVEYEKISFPWRFRLRRLPDEHPVSIPQFEKWQELDESAYVHREYLKLCDGNLVQGWIESWASVYAVGPFIGRRRPYNSIPFILVVNYRQPYRHIVRLSEMLADAYLEFSILPDIYVLAPRVVQGLDQVQNQQWFRTKQYSLMWNYNKD